MQLLPLPLSYTLTQLPHCRQSTKNRQHTKSNWKYVWAKREVAHRVFAELSNSFEIVLEPFASPTYTVPSELYKHHQKRKLSCFLVDSSAQRLPEEGEHYWSNTSNRTSICFKALAALPRELFTNLLLLKREVVDCRFDDRSTRVNRSMSLLTQFQHDYDI